MIHFTVNFSIPVIDDTHREQLKSAYALLSEALMKTGLSWESSSQYHYGEDPIEDGDSELFDRIAADFWESR